jgi:hypothetical protein
MKNETQTQFYTSSNYGYKNKPELVSMGYKTRRWPKSECHRYTGKGANETARQGGKAASLSATSIHQRAPTRSHVAVAAEPSQLLPTRATPPRPTISQPATPPVSLPWNASPVNFCPRRAPHATRPCQRRDDSIPTSCTSDRTSPSRRRRVLATPITSRAPCPCLCTRARYPQPGPVHRQAAECTQPPPFSLVRVHMHIGST